MVRMYGKKTPENSILWRWPGWPINEKLSRLEGGRVGKDLPYVSRGPGSEPGHCQEFSFPKEKKAPTSGSGQEALILVHSQSLTFLYGRRALSQWWGIGIALSLPLFLLNLASPSKPVYPTKSVSSEAAPLAKKLMMSWKKTLPGMLSGSRSFPDHVMKQRI